MRYFKDLRYLESTFTFPKRKMILEEMIKDYGWSIYRR